MTNGTSIRLGLGKATNNQTEALALLQGLRQLWREGILARVIKDSQSLIGFIVRKNQADGYPAKTNHAQNQENCIKISQAKLLRQE